ncbi:MAG: S16 family serine protease [Candidatus Aenigmatarchaeota archaeon]
MEKRDAVLIVAIIVVIAVSTYVNMLADTGVETRITPNATNATAASSKKGLAKPVYGNAAIMMPAVDNEGNGVVTWLTVDSTEGEGRTLVNINQLLFWVDTQYSIQTAKYVAENYTGYDLSNADIIYTIDTSANLIEGPSAGAALTVATVAALRNESINPDVLITGTITPYGEIGEVGGILEKAGAAKAVGAKLFLVPKGQAVESYYEQERECRHMGPITYCTTNYVPVTLDVSEKTGIEIKEVSTIGEALKYFLG